MVTTIQVSSNLLNELRKRKIYEKESYEEVIWNLIEDTVELSEEAKIEIKKAESDIRAGRVYTLEEVKKRLKLNV